MICRHCGQELPEGFTICFQCGTALDMVQHEIQNEVPISQPSQPRKRKFKVIAGILALFFGIYGLQDFYLGFTKRGILKILFFWTSIGVFWGWIDCVRIFTGAIKVDAHGTPLV